ncbi:hypothetical protein PC118_g7273 [Phytophthora cactorum]|uniref:Uncharacterized protein n=1 Tax=Phytophthora cactorum TaxID=29920 RepID=A0A8T0YSU3_9STRA|nr:hypothetical protein PC112_g13881 [Phytophthora cactorum]KAG2817223.1 hypothetical protein PC111_g12787 [Phytophthora cactorum]KAG2853402.1 hypothetical protein PC113_g14191 [Phytophthora cactorum]KAG2987434.1 hypothetical protein PC118_g7273 [Phytophthora cactorum]KAG3006759.1 hypothetical protein PC119_g14857 [Phytophthora cactorum]
MLSDVEEDFLLDESSVLAFLVDCEMENEAVVQPTVFSTSMPTQCDALTATWSDSSSSVSSPDKAPAKKSWRQRRKDEVLSLREVVKQLSAELERLKIAGGVHSTLPNALKTAPKFVLKAQAGHKTEASMMWEQIAGRQSMLRLSSEEENTKLREAVTRHLQQAKSLQRAIKRKLKEDMMSSSLDFIKRNRLNARGIAPPLDNKEVFDKLLAGIDSVYQGVDAFFEDTGMHTLSCPGRRNNTAISRVSKGVFVEFLDSYALPFDVRQTTKAIWTPEEDRSGHDNLYFLQSFTAGNNTQMRSMAFAFSMEGVDFRVVMRAVTRKYIENGRTVFIKRTLIQPIYGEMSISLIETSRQVLKRGDLSAVGPTTVMQTHREATIHGDLTVLDPTKYPSVDIGVKNWESSISRYNNGFKEFNQIILQLLARIPTTPPCHRPLRRRVGLHQTEGAIWTATDKSEDAAVLLLQVSCLELYCRQ